MNVLFHCYEFPPQAGGVGGYIFQMASALKACGHVPVVVTSRSTGLPEREDGPCGTVYRLYEKADIRTARVRDTVLAIAREHRADVIEGADHHGEMAGIIPFANRAPVLIKIHGSNPLRILQQSHVLHWWQKWTIRMAHLRNIEQTRAERFSIENADMALAPSLRIETELSRQGLRLPRKHAVIANPVSPVKGDFDAEAEAATLLLVARIDIGKGIQYLPGIVRGLVEEFPKLVLEIAGDDSYARGLGSLREWLTRKLGDKVHHVTFLGRLDRRRLDEAYARAWAVVLPSRWDNFPTVLLEAMARGKPVVASPHGGMPEMLAGTLCGVAEPGSRAFVNLIAALLRDRDLRRNAGKGLKAKAGTEYSPENIVRQYVDFVRS